MKYKGYNFRIDRTIVALPGEANHKTGMRLSLRMSSHGFVLPRGT